MCLAFLFHPVEGGFCPVQVAFGLQQQIGGLPSGDGSFFGICRHVDPGLSQCGSGRLYVNTLTGGNTDILVSDVGTAITYDHVSRDNVHHGGNIAPGIFMRLKALNHYTARLPLVEPEEVPTPLWGQSTETALCSGAILGVVAELEYYRSQLPPDAVVVLGGGGTHLLRDRLPFQHTVVNNLVSLGLNTIIRFNENAETHI